MPKHKELLYFISQEEEEWFFVKFKWHIKYNKKFSKSEALFYKFIQIIIAEMWAKISYYDDTELGRADKFSPYW